MNDLPEPAAELLVEDVEQLKALSDPLRLQILDAMGLEPRRGWTAKELAERLGGKQTKLYHHLNLLEARGFIRVAETNVVSGIVERRYQITARNFRMNRGLLAGRAEEVTTRILDAVFEKTRNDILSSIRAGLIDVDADALPRNRLALSSSSVRLSPASLRKVMRQIERLARMDELEDPDGDHYGLIVGLYPRTDEPDR